LERLWEVSDLIALIEAEETEVRKSSVSTERRRVMHRLPFLLMAIVQALFAIRALRNPRAVKDLNIRLGTVWANLPLSFVRGVGVVCAGAAILFFYLFLWPPSK
jgi:hypothetical protein